MAWQHFRTRRAIVPAGAAAYVLLRAPPASAHGFGQRYELPLPLSLYLFGGAAVVALSFLIFGLFLRRARAPADSAKVDLLAGPLGRAAPTAAFVLKTAIFALFVVTIIAGLIGNQNPYRNIAPTLVWIIWWVGFAYVSAIIGDLWALVSPWRTVFDLADWAYRQLGRRNELALRLRYPKALGAWPACALLLAFAWIELVYPDPAKPLHIAYLAIAYSLLTWAAMLAFGRDVWLAHGEIFALFFGLFSRLAPTEATAGRLYARPLGAGLLDNAGVSTSKMAFILLILASVLYDGLIGTPEWADFEGMLHRAAPANSDMAPIVIKTLGLVGFWLLFLGAYLGVCALMSVATGGEYAALALARDFALTLVPIAIGYHVAHYLVYLLIQGQYIIPLASDPFGHGWNLLGTAGYRIDIALAGARFTWYLALVAIVMGHVTAVYLAHLHASGTFAAPRTVWRTQVPLTMLMVVYTFIGLSISAEPIVENRTPAQPTAVTSAVAVPADALLPEAQTGQLQPVGAGKTAKLRLTYQTLGSVFQDGTKTSAADLLYAFAFAYRWGVRVNAEDQQYDPVVAAATALMREHLVALRVTGVDTASKSFRVGDVNFLREIFTIEAYLNLPVDDLDWNASVAPPFTTLPWHLLALMGEAVTRDWAAFSQAESERRGVPWLDLVRSEKLTAQLASLAAEFERSGYRPPALQSKVSEEEARKRWTALGAFYKAHGHLLITNGPYTIKSWSPGGVTLDAFRDLTYPLGVGSYDVYALPRRGFITNMEWDNQVLTISADIEVVERFQRSHRLTRTPLKSLPEVVARRAAPECRYIVADQTGRIVISGSEQAGDGSRFLITLKGQLPPGPYTISAFVTVNADAMNPDIHRISVVVNP
jgi:hypothetical protein